MMGRLMVASKNPSTLFERLQNEFGQFLVFLRCVTEIGAVAVLNVVENDAPERRGSTRENRVDAKCRGPDHIAAGRAENSEARGVGRL
jgi:hypothetical protein